MLNMKGEGRKQDYKCRLGHIVDIFQMNEILMEQNISMSFHDDEFLE